MTIAIFPVSIVSHTNLTPSAKEAERQRLAALVNQHLASGGAISTVPGFKPVPPPPRRKRIDPETVLKRRQLAPRARPPEQPPLTFAKLADQLETAPAPESPTLAQQLRQLAVEGQSLMSAARQLGISQTKARWHAERNRIMFVVRNQPTLSDAALLALAREQAAQGQTLTMAARALNCGADRLRRLADQQGIEFRKGGPGGARRQGNAQ